MVSIFGDKPGLPDLSKHIKRIDTISILRSLSALTDSKGGLRGAVSAAPDLTRALRSLAGGDLDICDGVIV